MSNKYLNRHHVVLVQTKTSTYVWKKMIKVREEVEAEMWWLIGQGNSYFWVDNWTGKGALHKLIPAGVDYDQTVVLVKEVAEAGQWNEQALRNLFP